MQTEHIAITGMTCGGCSGKVTRALSEVAGVGDVKVSLSAGEATVQFDEALTSLEQLNSAVARAGYGVRVTGAAEGPPSKSGCCC